MLPKPITEMLHFQSFHLQLPLPTPLITTYQENSLLFFSLYRHTLSCASLFHTVQLYFLHIEANTHNQQKKNYNSFYCHTRLFWWSGTEPHCLQGRPVKFPLSRVAFEFLPNTRDGG